ncbi:MAG TPA: hypothetical protein VL362_00450 [Patescibacteria group bacterium]|nr:hypothetical protein [Patescibacteria group bacterium]
MNEQKHIRAAENLGDGNIVDAEGDVLPDTDVTDDGLPMSNEGRIARMHPHTDVESLDEQPVASEEVAAELGKAASSLLLTAETREQANRTVAEFVSSLSDGQRKALHQIIEHFAQAQTDIRQAKRPRIHQATRRASREKATKENAAGRELLEQLTGASSDPKEDSYLVYGGWKQFILNNRAAILQELHDSDTDLRRTQKERLDDLGVSWREP